MITPDQDQLRKWNNIPSNPIEILEDIRCAFEENDFNRFAKYCLIKPKDSDSKINLCWDNLHPEQQQLCLNWSGKDIVVKSRQVGLSSVEQARDLFHCLQRGQRFCLIVAQHKETAKNLLEGIKLMYEDLSGFMIDLLADNDLPQSMNPFPPLFTSTRTSRTKYSVNEVSFSNGSMIKVVGAGSQERNAGKSIRSLAPSRIHITELAHWQLQSTTWDAIVPLIAEGIEIIVESTPLNKDDIFHELYRAAKDQTNGFKAHFFPWFINPKNRIKGVSDITPWDDFQRLMVSKYKITNEQLAFYQSKEKLQPDNPLSVQAEYPCDDQTCFLASLLKKAGQMWLSKEEQDYIKSIASKEISMEHLSFGLPLRIFEPVSPNLHYAIGVDGAYGNGADNTAFVILRIDNSQIVAIGYSQHIQQQEFGLLIDEVRRVYNNAHLAIEIPSGYTIHTVATEHNKENLYEGKFCAKYPGGWRSHPESRNALFSNLGSMIRSKSFAHIPRQIVNELLQLHWKDDNRIEALGKTKKGKKKPDSPMDDMVIALAIALHIAKEKASETNIVVGPSVKWSGPLVHSSNWINAGTKQLPMNSNDLKIGSFGNKFSSKRSIKMF